MLAAYGFNPRVDLLEQLLTLNQLVAKRITEDQAVVAPGIPASYPDPAKLVSADALGRP